jgi:hypothetical protein
MHDEASPFLFDCLSAILSLAAAPVNGAGHRQPTDRFPLRTGMTAVQTDYDMARARTRLPEITATVRRINPSAA